MLTVIRVILIGFVLLALSLLALQVRVVYRSHDLPSFLRTDSIALQHYSRIDLMDNSGIRHDESDLDLLAADYSAIWAHLDHLYTTTDVEAGKEYYTEDWFRSICADNPAIRIEPVTRQDYYHELHLIDLSTDNLVCTAIDSNVRLEYRYHLGPGRDSVVDKRLEIALALLFQGDHWRIDGLLFISEIRERWIWEISLGDPGFRLETIDVPSAAQFLELFPKSNKYETSLYLPLSAEPGDIE